MVNVTRPVTASNRSFLTHILVSTTIVIRFSGLSWSLLTMVVSTTIGLSLLWPQSVFVDPGGQYHNKFEVLWPQLVFVDPGGQYHDMFEVFWPWLVFVVPGSQYLNNTEALWPKLVFFLPWWSVP